MAYRRTAKVLAREERTRTAIVDAARSLVAAHGLAGAGVAAVADRAGVGIGTVYRQFPSKADLIGEVVSTVCRRELDLVAAVAATDRPASDRLADTVTVFAARALRSGRTAYAMILEPTESEVELLRLRIRSELAATFARIVADGVATGEFPPQSPSVSGTALVGAVSEVLVGPLTPFADTDITPADIGVLLDEIGRFAIRAVAPTLAPQEIA